MVISKHFSMVKFWNHHPIDSQPFEFVDVSGSQRKNHHSVDGSCDTQCKPPFYSLGQIFGLNKSSRCKLNEKKHEKPMEKILNDFYPVQISHVAQTLPKTNSSALKIGHPNRKVVFQSHHFSGASC